MPKLTALQLEQGCPCWMTSANPSGYRLRRLFDDDHAETIAALEAMSRPTAAPNVVPIRRRG